MTAPSHLDLLIDLVKLLKKYGPEQFRTLAAALRDPDQLASLSDTLDVLANESARFKTGSRDRQQARPNLRVQLEALTETAPEKADVLRTLLDQLMASDGMSLSEIRAYAKHAGLPQLKSGDRSRVVQAFVSSLLHLDLPQIQHHIQQLASQPQDKERNLEGWSRIILDPTLKVAQGS